MNTAYVQFFSYTQGIEPNGIYKMHESCDLIVSRIINMGITSSCSYKPCELTKLEMKGKTGFALLFGETSFRDDWESLPMKEIFCLVTFENTFKSLDEYETAYIFFMVAVGFKHYTRSSPPNIYKAKECIVTIDKTFEERGVLHPDGTTRWLEPPGIHEETVNENIRLAKIKMEENKRLAQLY